jgi:UDP-N-acetylglucosamine 4,6-dehydratase
LLDNQDISWTGEPTSPVFGKSVLVTGGSGAFGQAFVKRCLEDGARRVVVYSRGEAKQAEMKSSLKDTRVRYFIGDVRDLNRITDACRDVDIVVHAAALKRVEVCEEDPNEAIATNVFGTQSVARACIANGVSSAVLLSTDKAASPNTLYGATKLTAERLWVSSNVYSAGTSTRFSASRYGNVCNSTGSVIPTWRKQAESGTITITDPDMTRFWMSMEDAVNLVLLALKNMRGGEIFIPRIGSSTVGKLAQAVAPKASLHITGSRPGEKMHELLISNDEARNCYDAGTHFILEPEIRTWGNVPPLCYPKVPFGFEYGSANNPNQLGVEKLKQLVAA